MTTPLAALLSAAAASAPVGVPDGVARDVMHVVEVALRGAAQEIADMYDMTAEIVPPAAAEVLKASASALREA